MSAGSLAVRGKRLPLHIARRRTPGDLTRGCEIQNQRFKIRNPRLAAGAPRRSGGQGIFLDLLHASERTGTQGQRPGGPKEPSPGRQPWVQKALWFAGAPAGRKKRFRRGNSPRFCRPLRGLTGAGAWFPGLAPWTKLYRPLGGLPGPRCCCRRKLSQICHATAAGLPLLCRTPIGRASLTFRTAIPYYSILPGGPRGICGGVAQWQSEGLIIPRSGVRSSPPLPFTFSRLQQFLSSSISPTMGTFVT